jgi:transcriptional regulator with XRE-family HTH domain
MALGDKIKEIREKRGLSVQELADKMGTGKQNIYNWEANISKPSIESLTALAVALEVPISVLLEENNTHEYNGNHSKELAGRIPELTPEQRMKVVLDALQDESAYRFVPKSLLEGKYTLYLESEIEMKNKMMFMNFESKDQLVDNLKQRIDEFKERVQRLQEDIDFYKSTMSAQKGQ